MYEDHEDEVANRNKIWSGSRAPKKAQGQRSASVHYNYVKQDLCVQKLSQLADSMVTVFREEDDTSCKAHCFECTYEMHGTCSTCHDFIMRMLGHTMIHLIILGVCILSYQARYVRR